MAVLRTFPAGLFPFWFALLLSTGQPCFWRSLWCGLVPIVMNGLILIGRVCVR
nr:MAG TPA: hypothetical protein [Caudoviricetes sp.]